MYVHYSHVPFLILALWRLFVSLSVIVVGLDDIYSVGAVFSSSGKDSLSEEVDYAHLGHDFGVGLDGYMEESMVGSDAGVSKPHQGDLVTTSLSFLLVHLKIDGTAWAPSLSSAYIASMSLMQVHHLLRVSTHCRCLQIISHTTQRYSYSFEKNNIALECIVIHNSPWLKMSTLIPNKHQSVLSSLLPSYSMLCYAMLTDTHVHLFVPHRIRTVTVYLLTLWFQLIFSLHSRVLLFFSCFITPRSSFLFFQFLLMCVQPFRCVRSS